MLYAIYMSRKIEVYILVYFLIIGLTLDIFNSFKIFNLTILYYRLIYENNSFRATDINSLGGLLHLKQIAKFLSKKKVKLIIFSNTFVGKNLKPNIKINIIKKKIFDKNFFTLFVNWFFKTPIKKKNCNILISLNGIYHGL